MTHDEKQAIDAQIAAFWDRFNAHVRETLAAQKQEVEVKIKFDLQANLNAQEAAMRAQIDNASDKEGLLVEKQIQQNEASVAAWVQGQLNVMRAADETPRQQKAAPQPAPSFAQIPAPTFGTSPPQRTANFAVREEARQGAAEEMTKKFAAFQEQQRDPRLDAVNERADQRKDSLESAHFEAATQKYTKLSIETEEKFMARVQRAEQHALEIARKGPHLTPDGPTIKQ